MNRRKLVGAIAFGILMLIGLGSRYAPGFSQDDWGTWWRMAYLAAVCVAFFAAFYDRKNFPAKTWDFNPRRGLLYFFLGWIIFPVTIGIDAILGSGFTLSGIAVLTLVLSAFVGVLGTFTENVGV